MNPLRKLDLDRPVTFTRGTAIMVGLVLGVILGGLFYLNTQALERAADARARLAAGQLAITDAIRRLEAIERPTVSRERAAIDRRLDRLTRRQLRRLLRNLLDAAGPADRRRLERLATRPPAAPRRRQPPRRLRPPSRRRPTPGVRNPQRPTDPAGPQTPAPSPPTPAPPPPLIPTLPGLPSLPGLPLP